MKDGNTDSSDNTNTRNPTLKNTQQQRQQQDLLRRREEQQQQQQRELILTLGLKNTDGTDNMDTTTSTSAEHPSFSEKMSIFARGGSSGNSTILRPRAVRPPVLSRAPRIHSWYSDDWMLSCEMREVRQFSEKWGDGGAQLGSCRGGGGSRVQASTVGTTAVLPDAILRETCLKKRFLWVRGVADLINQRAERVLRGGRSHDRYRERQPYPCHRRR